MPSLDELRFGRDVLLSEDPDGTVRITPTGDLQTVAGRDNLRLAVRRRAATTPGEMVHRPEYGGGALDALERPNTAAERARLASTIRRSLLRDARIVDAQVSAAAGIPGDSTRRTGVTVDMTIVPRGDDSGERITLSLTE